MRVAWLNLILSLTNDIYKRKQKLPAQTGTKIVVSVFVLVMMEIFLAIVSLPLYITMKTANVAAFFSEKGGYAKVAFDYNLRRIMTLTGVGIVAIVWALKLGLIIGVPSVFGPMQLYSVSNFHPADILSKNLIAQEIGTQTARIIETMPAPILVDVIKHAGGRYDFVGTAQSGVTVVLLLSGQQTAIYTTKADESGAWTINQTREDFQLSEGNHSLIVYSYDAKNGLRSPAAPEQFFKVTSTWLDVLAEKLDVFANWTVILIVLLGVFLTFLTM
jgi:hypothetical protein